MLYHVLCLAGNTLLRNHAWLCVLVGGIIRVDGPATAMQAHDTFLQHPKLALFLGGCSVCLFALVCFVLFCFCFQNAPASCTGCIGCTAQMEAALMLFGNKLDTNRRNPDSPEEQALTWATTLSSGVFASAGAFAAGTLLAAATAASRTAPANSSAGVSAATNEEFEMPNMPGSTQDPGLPTTSTSTSQLTDGATDQDSAARPSSPQHCSYCAAGSVVAVLAAVIAGTLAASILPRHSEHAALVWVMALSVPGMLVRHLLSAHIPAKTFRVCVSVCLSVSVCPCLCLCLCLCV